MRVIPIAKIGNTVDLDQNPPEQVPCSNQPACGNALSKITMIRLIESVAVGEIEKKYIDPHDILKRRAFAFKSCLDRVHGSRGLFFNRRALNGAGQVDWTESREK